MSSWSLVVRSFFSAVAFALIESVYCGLDGKPFGSSTAQFWNNIWSHPIIADMYWEVMPDMPWVRVVMYPVLIWGIEIGQGTVIKFVYGRNVAWDYSINKWGRMDGLIDLSMIFELWILGLVMEFVYPHVKASVDILV